MKTQVMCRLSPRAVLVGLLLLGTNGWAQVPGEKISGGIVFRIGIAPAEQVESQSLENMHPSRPRSSREHVVVALTEERSGKRIEDAKVTVSVSRAGMDHVSRPLERMDSPGATSYGGFFDLRQPGPYRIRIEVARPGSPAPAAAEFDYGNR